MTTHNHRTSGRRTFFARLFAGAGALAAAVGTAWTRSTSTSQDPRPTARPRVRLHPDAVPRTSEQSTTHG